MSAPGPGPLRQPPLERYAVAAALWTVATAGLAAGLGGLGLWRPWLVVPILLALAVVCARATRGLPRIPLDRLSLAALVTVAALAGVLYGATHAEQVLPRRDAGSNLQAAISLASTGSRVVAIDPGTVGAPGSLEVEGITLAGPAFYEVGSPDEPGIEPQFPVGPAALLSLGVWAGEPSGSLTPALLLAPVAMALALLAIGLLAASILGPRTGPVAALAVAVTFPVVHISRSTYSEPFATLSLAAGLLCLTLAARDRSARAAVLAGILVGGTTLIRIDALREVVLVVVAATVYAARGHLWTRPLFRWLAGSTGVGLLAAVVLSPRYLSDITGSLVPLVAGGVVVCAVAAGVVLGANRATARSVPGDDVDSRATGRPRPPRPLVGPTWLPTGAGVVVVLVGIVLVTRPLWQVVRQSPDDPGSRVVAGLQLRQGLPVDGGRTYAERTVEWLAWWVGPVALGVALLVLAAATALVVRGWQAGRLPAWAGVLLVAAGSSLLTLWRPGITPDHPWAERRLVIPLTLVVVLVVAAASWCLRQDRSAPVRRGSAAVAMVVLLVPTAVATWPHLPHRVEAGSLAAVDGACDGFETGDVALMVDARAANEWPQVLRGQCGVPALATTAGLRSDPAALAAAVAQVRGHIEAQGRRLVLVAAEDPEPLAVLSDDEPDLLVDGTVLEDARLLEERPGRLVPLRITLWSAVANA